MQNIKTLLFFLLICLSALLPWLLSQKEDSRKSLDLFYAQSEDAREIYTGKVREVFEPLDEAYAVTAKLMELIDKTTLQVKEDDPWPLLSVWVNPEDLNSEQKGIIVNGLKKGRLWERASFVRFYEKGNLEFESFAGIRQHGGSSRNPSVPLKSFRLYFKKKYGEDEFLPNKNLTLKPDSKIKRLVVHRDSLLHFGGDLAFFLINNLGGIAPNTKYVRFYLNDQFYGHHTLTEHLSEEQLTNFWGHKNFVFAKIKGDKDIVSRLLYNDIRDRLEQSSKISYKYVDKEIDLESMISSVIVIMYTGNTDWSQGVYTKDLKNDSKWKLISWDFDRAFYPVKGESYSENIKNDYEMDSTRIVMDSKKGKIRWSLFNRLIHNDEQFRDYFSSKIDELFKFLETKEFDNKMREYDALAKSAASKNLKRDLDKIREFIKGRKSVFCKSLLVDVNLSPASCK